MHCKKITYLIFLGLLLLFGCRETTDKQTTLRIGTATTEGNYYPLGKSIRSVLDSTTSDLKAEILNTKGSVDNILKLERKEIDLAIVQNDVAFFAENGLDPFNKEMQNLAGIASFYSEPIYVLTNDPSINYLSQLTNKKINIGPVRSGLYTDAKIIFNSLNLWSVVTKRTEAPDEGLKALLGGKLDAAFINAIPEKYKQAVKEEQLELIPIKPSTISKLAQTYPYFTEFETRQFGTNQTTIAIKAILIGRKEIKDNLIYKLTKNLHENFSQLDFPEYYLSATQEDIINSMSLNGFHQGSQKYYQQIGLLESQKWLRISGVIFLILASLIFVVFLLNIFLFSKLFNNQRYASANSKILRLIKRSHKFVTRHKYLVVLFFMITAYITIIILVKEIEHNWAIQNNSVSNFDNRSFGKNLLWIFIFGGSGYSDNLFPNSPIAKFLVTLIPLIGIGGFLTLAGFFTSDHIKNRLLKARGVKSNMVKNHIILCGWNENVPFLIDNLLHKNIVNKKPIVLLAEMEDDIPLESNNIDHDLVTYVRGKATKKSDLDRANIQEADIAIIVSDPQASEPDAKCVLKILTIEKYCRQLEKEGKRNGKDNIYTIAEIQDTENFDSAYDADVDEIISLGHIKSKILVHSVLNPGVSNFINEILTYNEFNDIYSIPIEKDSNLLGKNFDQILKKLRDEKILLLSISIGNHKNRSELKSVKEKMQLSRTVLTNPITKEETKYETQPGDTLIVLAKREQTVKNALSEIEE